MAAEVIYDNPLDRDMNALEEFVFRQANTETAQTRDPYLRALYGALSQNLSSHWENGAFERNNHAFYEEIKSIWSWTRDVHDSEDAEDFARRLVHTFKAVETKDAERDPRNGQEVWFPRVGDKDFPRGLDKPENWQPYIDKLVDDPDYAGQFWIYMGLPVAANVSGRSKVWKLSMLLHGVEGKGIEFGGSLGHNILRLVRSHDPLFYYEETTIGDWRGSAGYQSNPAASMAVNAALRQSVNLRRSVNVDLQDYSHRDSVYRHWATSNSSSFQELLDPEHARHLRTLSKLTPPKLIQEDVRQLDERIVKKVLRGPAHTGFASMLLHQIHEPQEVSLAVERMRACIKKGGQLIVLDWRELHPDGTVATEVESESNIKNWDPFTLNWYVETLGSKDGLQKYGVVDNGRVKTIALTEAAKAAPRAAEMGLTT